MEEYFFHRFQAGNFPFFAHARKPNRSFARQTFLARNRVKDSSTNGLEENPGISWVASLDLSSLSRNWLKILSRSRLKISFDTLLPSSVNLLSNSARDKIPPLRFSFPLPLPLPSPSSLSLSLFSWLKDDGCTLPPTSTARVFRSASFEPSALHSFFHVFPA